MNFRNANIIISRMNFLKNMLGFPKDIKERIRNFKTKGTYFEVIKDTRNVKIKECIITFSQAQDKTMIEFHDKEAVTKQIINIGMNPVSFSIQKEGKSHACFEWQLEKENLHAGCYMDVDSKKQFKDILCLVLKDLSKDEHIKDHETLCKELSGIPVYKKEKQSKISTITASREHLNNILIAQAQKNENKMVHSCNYYEIEMRERKLIKQQAIFVLKTHPNFQFSFEIIDNSGAVALTKAVDSYLNYEINLDGGYIRWIDIDRNCAIVEVNFQGRKDAALSLKYNMLEVMYEIQAKKKINEEINQEEIAYIRRVNEEKPFEEKANSKIIEIYDQKETIQETSEQSYLYEDVDRKKGITYNNVCQAKVYNFSIAALGSLLQTLQIGEDSHIKQSDKQLLLDKEGKEVDVGEIVLHQSDTKALIRGKNGKLYYQDLQKATIIEQFNPNPSKEIVAICPEFKEIGSSFKTFKAIGEKTIYEIDPRLKDGVGNMKDYTANNQFLSLASTGKGDYVTGASNGQIRFYNQIGKNANNKFTSAGDAVISLDTTKDGKWILATFRRFLRLIPTINDNEISLFQTKVPFSDRPTPIKLEISLEDLQKYGIKDFKFLPAKFNESKESVERFIVSGFGEYTVIWTLGKAIKGDRSYVVSKNEGTVVQADFRFNDPTRLLMATSEGLLIRENKIKN